jgi:cell division protein ZapA
MPEVTLSIGEREFRVACQAGEEAQLEQAAALLDAEAGTLQKAIGRIPEPRMLLMAGLMLADRTIEIATRVQELEEETGQLRERLARAEAQAAEAHTAGDGAAAREALKVLEAATERAERLAGRDSV